MLNSVFRSSGELSLATDEWKPLALFTIRIDKLWLAEALGALTLCCACVTLPISKINPRMIYLRLAGILVPYSDAF